MISFRSTACLKQVLVLSAALSILIGFTPVATAPAHAAETPTVAAPDMQGVDYDPKDAEEKKKEIEKLLTDIENDWNAHNLDAVMNYYSDDYLNNDGLDKKAVLELTKDFWKTYPDAKSTSKTKQIRIEGQFVTVESTDTAIGTTAKEMAGIGTKGELQSVSEGQLYLKKQSGTWRIVGDRIDYEKVKVSFGLARQLQASFSAPEQIKSGRQYTARLEVNLPAGLTAVGSITSAALQYPQVQPDDFWRPMSEPALEKPVLERVMTANAKNRNELLMATIGITNSARNSLMGIAFLTRRLNVVPSMEEETVKIVEKEKDKTKELGHFNVPSTTPDTNPKEGQ